MRLRSPCLLFALLVLAGCRGHPRNVVLITIDTLRADHVGAYGYPRPTARATASRRASTTSPSRPTSTAPAR
jgi:glucan phosphoethanolaminetransferase (alkaline phosphatase superfamily)